VWAAHRDPDGNYAPPGATDDQFYYTGFARTDADGRFEFDTIRPGGGGGPSHIHIAVIVPGRAESLGPEIWFADEPSLPPTNGDAIVSSPRPEGPGVAIDLQLVLRDE
jgi:protocatechuate 3,4-dioxygenase beta subunit